MPHVRTTKPKRKQGGIAVPGKVLQEAMLRRQISAAEVGRSAGVSTATVLKWCAKEVPAKHAKAIKKYLNSAELAAYGGHHQDMFPETLRGAL